MATQVERFKNADPLEEVVRRSLERGRDQEPYDRRMSIEEVAREIVTIEPIATKQTERTVEDMRLALLRTKEPAAEPDRATNMRDWMAREGKPRISMRFGSQKLNLRPVSATQEEWFTARNPAAGSADLCFLVSVDPHTVATQVKNFNVAIEQGPVIKHGALGDIRSVYCRDPDGSLIKISSYPG